MHTYYLFNASTITNTMHTQILNSTSIEILPLRWAISTIFRHFFCEQANAIVSSSLQVWLSLLSIFILLEFSVLVPTCTVYLQCCAIDGWKATELAGKPNKHSVPTQTHSCRVSFAVCATRRWWNSPQKCASEREEYFFQSWFFSSPLPIFSPQRAWRGWLQLFFCYWNMKAHNSYS